MVPRKYSCPSEPANIYLPPRVGAEPGNFFKVWLSEVAFAKLAPGAKQGEGGGREVGVSVVPRFRQK
jgi:hypothetical protein